MGALWLCIRAEFRASWRAVTVVLLLVAVGGGVALAALAGARRTQTAMPRLLAYNRPEDASVFFNASPAVAARVLALPQVARSMRLPYLYMSIDASGRDPGTAVFGAGDDVALRSIERPMVVRGRAARPERSSEAMVSDAVARRAHLRVGSRVTLYGYSLQQALAAGNGAFGRPQRPRGPRLSVEVVGVVREPTDIAVVPVNQNVAYGGSGAIYLTPAFVRRFAVALGVPFERLPGNEIVRVRFRHGTSDLAAFTTAASAIAGSGVQILPGSAIRDTAAAAQRGIRVEVVALLMFAAVAALATILVVTLNFARMLQTEITDHAKLAVLGMTRGRRVAVALARPVVIAVGGGLGAVLVAVALSPFTPIGVARQAELDPGFAVNAAILAAGAGALVLVLVAGASVAAVRASAPGATGTRRVRGRAGAGVTLDRLGLSPAARLGVGAAWSRREARTTPRRGAVVAIALAVAGVAAAATFGASLGHLVDSPREQGWNFDVIVGNPNSQSDQEARAIPLFTHNPYVAGFSGLAQPPETPTIDGHSVGLVGVDERKGALGPVMLAGRFPAGPDEIALGRRSLRALRKRVGDRVDVVAGPRRMSMEVTGALITMSAGDLFSGRLDEGGAATLEGLRRLEPDAIVTMFAVRYAPAADRRVAFARLQHDFGTLVLQHVAAQDVENLVRVAALPALLAGLLMLLGVATLAASLLASVRRRRHELTILKAIGFERGQLAASVMWQTWALTLVGVAVGIPVGVVVGRSAWRFVADQIGAVQSAVAPIAEIASIIAGAALVATIVALVPAWLAARAGPPTALRSE